MSKRKTPAPRSRRAEGNVGVHHTGHITLPPGAIPSPSGGKSHALDFTDALMRGNPTALKALADAGVDFSDVDAVETRVNVEEPSWADEFIASTYRFPKAMSMDAHTAKSLEPVLASYRDDMRRAHRFVLDNAFTRLATEVSSTTPPEKLLARVQYASLPYEITWIEFDLPTKVHTMRRIHGLNEHVDDLGRKMGVLMHRISDTEAVVQMIVEASGMPVITPTMICYYFSLREFAFDRNSGWAATGCRPFLAATGENFLNSPIKEKEALAIGKASLWGYSNADSNIVLKPADLFKLRLPNYLMRHGDIGFSQMFHGLLHAYGNQTVRGKGLANLVTHEMGEFTGMMRWLIIVLAMLNEVPVYTSHQQPRGQIRVGLTSKRRFMDYHRVTLRLPKTDPIKYVERHLRNATRRHRAHEVRAFWRTYLSEQHCAPDQHEWTYDHDAGYRLCGKCMAFGRYIHEHVRGDETLGWVRKDYVIKEQQ